MAESILQACSPLDALEIRHGELLLRERNHLALVSMATSTADDAALAGPLKARYQLALPAIGRSSTSENENFRLMGLQPGLWLLLFEHPGSDPLKALRGGDTGSLPATARLTDQSDAWVFLELQGPGATAALERLCPLDLHPDFFEVGHLSRTVFELMGTILIRTDIDCWLMLSARSTASSFVHAVSTAVESVT